jgi:hypothetical protein
MAVFVFAYRSTQDYNSTPEGVIEWRAWFEGLGEHVVELGLPAAAAAGVGNCDTESTHLGGYSLISADDLESAMALTKGCPQLSRGGGIEIGQLVPVPEAVSSAAK